MTNTALRSSTPVLYGRTGRLNRAFALSGIEKYPLALVIQSIHSARAVLTPEGVARLGAIVLTGGLFLLRPCAGVALLTTLFIEGLQKTTLLFQALARCRRSVGRIARKRHRGRARRRRPVAEVSAALGVGPLLRLPGQRRIGHTKDQQHTTQAA